jgi:hypothetical protein
VVRGGRRAAATAGVCSARARWLRLLADAATELDPGARPSLSALADRLARCEPRMRDDGADAEDAACVRAALAASKRRAAEDAAHRHRAEQSRHDEGGTAVGVSAGLRLRRYNWYKV